MSHFTGFGTVGLMASRAMNHGFLTEYGYHLPPGGNVVAYVGASSLDDGYLNPGQRKLRIPTLNEAFPRVNAGAGDTVMVLPGHTENVDAADAMSALKAGTRILGMGYGTLIPQLTWTVAGATFLFDVDNVMMANMRLNFASSGNGGVTVAAPMTWAGDGCGLAGCEIYFGDDADDKVGTGITVTGDGCYMMGCHAIGATAAECTSFLDLNAAHRWRMYDTIIEGATSNVAVGLMRFVTAASLNIDLRRNSYLNRKALSTCAVTGLAAVSGTSRSELFHYLDDASDTPWLTSNGIMAFYDAKVVNLAGENALPATPVSV